MKDDTQFFKLFYAASPAHPRASASDGGGTPPLQACGTTATWSANLLHALR
jgi:hypothetical protein